MSAKLPTLQVGIAAYNAERNIGRLLTSLLGQTATAYIPGQIVVHSDASSDETVTIAKRFEGPRVRVVDCRERGGFAQSFARLLADSSRVDVVLMLNDDVVLTDAQYLDKIVRTFDSPRVGLVCGSLRPLAADGFVERATGCGFNAYRYVGEHIRNGESGLTCDGKAMALSRAFVEELMFPADARALANVDGYIYLACVQQGFGYRYARDASLQFRSPATLADFLKWQSRNYASRNVWRETFGALVDREYPSSRLMLAYAQAVELVRHPLPALFMMALTVYCGRTMRQAQSTFSPTWEPVQTTKQL
jgi:glycosyltransferase involved in cell wall biosynthesis